MAMSDPTQFLTRQFLEWVDARPRRYADVMEAWRTSCPRLPVWEEAMGNDLVRIDHASGKAMGDCAVVLTARGRDALATEAMG
jgi:hypothetical protein